MLHGRRPALRRQLRERLLKVTLDDLQRVAKQYLVNQRPDRAVVAPMAKREQLSELGFKIYQVN